jgi:hypothetical protein
MLTSVILSRRAVEAGVALDRLSGWGASLPGRVIHSGSLQTESLVGNPTLIGRGYPMSE